MVATYLAFYFWFSATVGILLGMDVMEPCRSSWLASWSGIGLKNDGSWFFPLSPDATRLNWYRVDV